MQNAQPFFVTELFYRYFCRITIDMNNVQT